MKLTRKFNKWMENQIVLIFSHFNASRCRKDTEGLFQDLRILLKKKQSHFQFYQEDSCCQDQLWYLKIQMVDKLPPFIWLCSHHHWTWNRTASIVLYSKWLSLKVAWWWQFETRISLALLLMTIIMWGNHCWKYLQRFVPLILRLVCKYVLLK